MHIFIYIRVPVIPSGSGCRGYDTGPALLLSSSGFLLILSHLMITDPGVWYVLGSKDLRMMAPTAFLSYAAEGASGSWSNGWPVHNRGRTGHGQATVGLGRMAISPSCSFSPGQPGCLANSFSSSIPFFSGNIIITYLSQTPVLLDYEFEI
jgi:hypothetical protein